MQGAQYSINQPRQALQLKCCLAHQHEVSKYMLDSVVSAELDLDVQPLKILLASPA